MELSKKYKIIRLICLIIFIISCVILIIEAATPGVNSANKSNAVSDAIASVINNVSEAITKKPKITNIDEFRAFIRKLVGHYGAFLFMSIFATLTGFLYYVRKEWKIFWIKVIIIIGYGFLFAIITELIQLAVPGRAGNFKDVFIDFFGYMTSSLVIIIIFFIINYKKTKNQIVEDNIKLDKETEEVE